MSNNRYQQDVLDDDMNSFLGMHEVRHGCLCLRLEILTYVYFQPAGQVWDGFASTLFQVDDWTPDDIRSFNVFFRKGIEDGWGNGAIWLVHATKGVPDVWCDVQLTYLPDPKAAQMCVMAVKNPVAIGWDGKPNSQLPVWRSGCAPFSRVAPGQENPFDMRIPYEYVVDPSGQRPGTVVNYGLDKNGEQFAFGQQPAQHEFGHYLRLAHPFPGPAGSPYQYGWGLEASDMANIMAMGSQFRAERVGIPFRGRLDKHHYVSSNVEAWMAKNYDPFGGGDRHTRPWPDGHFPTFDTEGRDQRWLEAPKP